jgi:phosphate-selective porin OprO/OprP
LHAADPPTLPVPPSVNTVKLRDEFASDIVVPVPAAQLAKPTADVPTKPTEEPSKVLPEPSQSVTSEEPTTTSSAPSIRLRGRVEADAIFASQNPKDKLLFGNFENAVGFRRARLGAEGDVAEQTRWVAEFDFAGGNIAFKDVFVAINKLPVVREIRVGHQAEPFSLEGFTRSVWFPFTERSPAYTFDPARNWGVAIYSYDDDQRIFFQAGAFRSGTDNNTGNDIGDGNDMAYTGRLVFMPIYEDSEDSLYLLHVGGAASQRYPKNNTVRFNQGPQSTLLQTSDNPVIPFEPSISIPSTQYQLYNLQAALVLGPLSFQAEWNATNVTQIGGGPVFLQGAYVFGSLFLTGEHREYNREIGTFWMPHVNSPFMCTDDSKTIGQGPGAWELTARWAWLDFDSPNLQPQPNGLKVGNRVTTWTFGINWYLNDRVRLMFDYVHAIPMDANFGPSIADIFTIRTAIFW